ncbi:MAG: hypothetical protein GX248_11170 [Peptococcaceae bacterium]|jgi:hypothetical protein|nr:hypothetical protein [Peptococcaceae bacterium]
MANQVNPGPCPPEGCPSPTQIDCIVVDKVYDSCYQIEDRSRITSVTTGTDNDWPTGDFTVGQVVPCALTAGSEISCTEISRVPGEDGFVTVTVLVSVPLTLTNPNAEEETVDRVFNFTKTAVLCCPSGVDPDCSRSTLQYCNCVITQVGVDTVEVTCDFQVCLILECILTVQLLVPSYGFCTPAPCTALPPSACPPSPPPQCF